jgi:hypothetical protein
MVSRSGQSMVETLVAMLLICLLFSGFYQVSQILAAREVLQHAAARGARAKTVGFNRWMVDKCVYAAAIPNSGRLLEPEYENINRVLRELVATEKSGVLWDRLLGMRPVSAQLELENARIPEFLASENYPRSRFVLNYENWENRSIWHDVSGVSEGGGGEAAIGEITVTAGQHFPLTAPAHRAFYADDEVELKSESWIENHYPLYIDDAYL